MFLLILILMILLIISKFVRGKYKNGNINLTNLDFFATIGIQGMEFQYLSYISENTEEVIS